MLRWAATLLAAAYFSWAHAAAGQQAAPSPFERLASGYAKRDGREASLAYAPDAELIYRYDGSPEERHRGRPVIEKSFVTFLGQFGSDQAVDLNFRTLQQQGRRQSGIYRLRIGQSASYGRYDVELDQDGRFARDVGTSATVSDFEEAAGPVMLRPDDEELDRSYYAAMTGRYRLPDGCPLIVTRSVVRLFVRNGCTQEWRGLTRRSGREWTAGDKVISSKPLSQYRFAPIANGASPSVTVSTEGKAITAIRTQSYATSPVEIVADDGVRLAGTIYRPAGKGPFPATVMIHGSGSQDRDGYASIIAVMADLLASRGQVVLAYDKRGSGASGGDGNKANFARLAGDARAAMRAVRTVAGVDAKRIGVAGSSQAGWVAAKLVEQGGQPAHVILLGAAGSASRVTEQNLYNTGVRMRCAGIADADIRQALEQQRAFFAARRNRSQVGELDRLTAAARGNAAIADWIFPGSEGLADPSAWYNALEVDFDPLSVWRRYRGRLVMIFSQFDDSTDTATSVRRLRGVRGNKIIVAGSQHLGLETHDICRGDLTELRRFSSKAVDAIGIRR